MRWAQFYPYARGMVREAELKAVIDMSGGFVWMLCCLGFVGKAMFGDAGLLIITAFPSGVCCFG